MSRYQFQSTPGISAGRYPECIHHITSAGCFNPLPAFLPGDTQQHGCSRYGSRRFNPLPAFLPGDTAQEQFDSGNIPVSIHSRHFCREIPRR